VTTRAVRARQGEAASTGKRGRAASGDGRQVASPVVLIVIDLAASTVFLREPHEFTRFSVALEGEGDLAQVVHQAGLGRLAADDEHIVVDPGAVRALAGPVADEGWDEGFAGMCAYAAGKGWVEADGGVLAHIQPRSEPG
jgi:hypothetical protein